MLNRHLIATTRPIANPQNIILWRDYRVTVLQDRLFRIEKSKSKQFRDDATQTIWFRDMPRQEFNVFKTADELAVQTNSATLVIKPKRKDCFVEINGKKIPLSNAGNLGGTARTLDGADGDKISYPFAGKRVNLGNGVCSKTGVAVLSDERSLTLDKNGEILPKRGHGSDEYVFAYGEDYREAVQALYLITGKTPLVPRFALGNWWSRYHAYTQDEYLRLINRFEEREIPLTVATIDMDWHWSDDVDRQKKITESGRAKEGASYGEWWSLGWTGYSWNTELFPDYRQFLKQLREKNLTITLNLHPADGVRFWEDQYEEMANAMGVDPSSSQPIKFNFKDANFINHYFKILHKPYEREGVDFWWIDWQQGEADAWGGIDPLWALNHYHYLDNAVNHFSPLILSRYAGLGSHRYPLGFSGDTYVTKETLAYLPYFTATATNVGYTWWSHDIGGHQQGEKNDDLYVRHVQYGVFSPINRLHCSAWETMSKEPWYYQNGSGLIVGEWLRFRHKLIPFLYSCSYETHKRGRALVEPLYYEWKQPQAYEVKTQYLFGGQMIVSPVIENRRKDGYARVKTWLPSGCWTDIFTGDRYEIEGAGKTLTLLRTLDNIPVLIKSGGVLPLSNDKGNRVDNPTSLDICVWQGDGEYTLYEDKKIRSSTAELHTKFELQYEERAGACTQRMCIYAYGNNSVAPKNRRLRVLFKDIFDGDILVEKNGEKLDGVERLTDCLAVEFPFDASAVYQLRVKFQKRTKLEQLTRRATDVLLRAEGISANKKQLYDELQKVKSVSAYKTAVENADLPSVLKLRLLETLQ